MKYLWALSGCLIFSQAVLAGPSINIGTVYDYLDGDKSTYLKRVFNGGDSTAFVQVNILEILYDAQGSATEVPLNSQADGSARSGLTVSPARMIVPANGVQGTRLLYMGERDQERYFRVRFMPVVPKEEDGFTVSQEEREDNKKVLSSGGAVLAGYSSVFFVRPKVTRFDSVIQDGPVNYEIRNNGNSVVLIDEFKDCAASNELDCQPTTKRHILPGRHFQFEKHPGRVYRFTLIEGEASKWLDVKG